MKESIIRRMKERGLKLTPQRLAVIEVLVDKTPLHPSADLIGPAAEAAVEANHLKEAPK